MKTNEQGLVQITAYVPQDVAEKILASADQEQRTLSNWLRLKLTEIVADRPAA